MDTVNLEQKLEPRNKAEYTMSKRRKRKYKILVIGKSNSILNKVIVSTLAKEGFRITTHSDHLEPLSGRDKLKADLVILGQGLPVDSFEVCSQLRQAMDIPILILGEISRAEGWVRAVEAGADLYLVKSINHSELAARVKAILRRREWTLAKNNFVKRRGGSRDENA